MFKSLAAKFKEVKYIEPMVFEDNRGYFFEAYNKKELKDIIGDIDFVQDNQSYSKYIGTVRGIHYQLPPMAQSKLVRCVRGIIIDVVVDLRPNSPTFLDHETFILSDANKRMVFIPKGFGHAFITLSQDTVVLYKTDNYYSPEHDRSILYNDPKINITWPLPDNEIILSEKDKNGLLIDDILVELNMFSIYYKNE